MISIYLSSWTYKKNFQSMLIIGGYDKKYFKNKQQKIIWLEGVSNELYAFNISFFYMGTKYKKREVYLPIYTALLDTGTATLLLPNSSGEHL